MLRVGPSYRRVQSSVNRSVLKLCTEILCTCVDEVFLCFFMTYIDCFFIETGDRFVYGEN